MELLLPTLVGFLSIVLWVSLIQAESKKDPAWGALAFMTHILLLTEFMKFFK